MGKDVLLNLPTGYGKSLVFEIAPEVRAELESLKGNNNSRPIVVDKSNGRSGGLFKEHWNPNGFN